MLELANFKETISKYKVIFFDAFGVLKTYNGLIAGVDRTLDFLRQNNQEFYILTNDASRSPAQLSAYYTRLGLHSVLPECVVSSGMLAREYLSLKVKTGTVVYLGTPDSTCYIRDLGLNLLPIKDLDLNDIAHINAVVLLDDEGFDWNYDLSKTINLLRRRNIPVVVANTDLTYPVSKHQVAIAIGGLADMLETLVGKRFIRFGKPDAQLFIYAYERMKNYPNVSKDQILMVGDTLQTDILGGNKFGLDTALVLTGNTQIEDVQVRISSTGIVPTYVCESAVID